MLVQRDFHKLPCLTQCRVPELRSRPQAALASRLQRLWQVCAGPGRLSPTAPPMQILAADGRPAPPAAALPLAPSSADTARRGGPPARVHGPTAAGDSKRRAPTQVAGAAATPSSSGSLRPASQQVRAAGTVAPRDADGPTGGGWGTVTGCAACEAVTASCCRTCACWCRADPCTFSNLRVAA